MKTRVQDISNRKQIKEGNEKKPFNKQKYRLQKYSNKYKINKWEERKKKAILRSFYKQIDKDQQRNLKKPFALKDDNQSEHKTQPPKKNAFYKAKQEFLRKKNEKSKQREEAARVKAEREEALKKYKEKKMQTYKKLSKKTKKGQPVMKDRLEMLLEKIQQEVST